MNASFLKLTPVQVLALTIFGEARGEPTEGKIAVGSVILERVDHRDWDGKTIPEVCFKPWQFSCYNEHDPNYPKLLEIAEHWNDKSMPLDMALNNCYGIAAGLISGNIPRTPEIARTHCCNYATSLGAMRATWDDNMKVIAHIGGHIFYG